MTFDIAPKKIGKKPKLTIKKKPKEDQDEVLNDKKTEELMNIESAPKKLGKKPVLTKKVKPEEESA